MDLAVLGMGLLVLLDAHGFLTKEIGAAHSVVADRFLPSGRTRESDPYVERVSAEANNLTKPFEVVLDSVKIDVEGHVLDDNGLVDLGLGTGTCRQRHI